MSARLAACVVCFLLCTIPAGAPAATGDCGQPQSSGSGPKTSDALAALRRAVGAPSACDVEPCICDVGGDGSVTTSDALKILLAAVGQQVTFACDCGDQCLAVGNSSLVATTDRSSRATDVPTRQVLLEVKLVGLDKNYAQQVGLDFALLAGLSTDAGPAAGGTNGNDATIAVDSNASGGPADLQYLLYKNHRPEGALAVLNKNFQSPFNGVKSFFPLPGSCTIFSNDAISTPQNFPGTTPVENVPPADAGYNGSVLYDLFNGSAAAALLGALQNDNRNTVLSAPSIRMYPGQTAFQMIDDVTPTVPQVNTDFRTRIQAVTMNPIGIFTGPTLDVTPQINGNNVELDVRVGTLFATFFFSTAFQVDGVPVDAEIPLHRRSRNVASMSVPAGQTMVLGGLKRTGQDAEIGLPVLGDVPLVGNSFTRKKLDPSRQNLLVFITPTVIDLQ